MPVDIPDARVHEFCARCKQWHEPEEGSHCTLRSGGPVGQMQAFGDYLMGKKRGRRFMCFACQQRRERLRKMWASVVIIAAVLFIAAMTVLSLWYLTRFRLG